MNAIIDTGQTRQNATHNIAGWRAFAYLSSTLAAIAWTLYAGKDLNWDALNYHLYAGFSALNDRFASDYFAASLQGYLNPYAHVPFYVMVQANWPAWIIGCTLACFHALNLWLCYELALHLIPEPQRRTAQMTALLGVIFAFLNPVFLQELGSSFNDISTCVLVLGGWVALVRGIRQPRPRLWALGGALLGASAALKLSNAVFCLAVAPMLLYISPSSDRFKCTGALVLSGCAGFFAVSGPWAYRLWQELGNPYFPMFNEYFKSPHLTSTPIKYYRFIPESVLDALMRPIQMAWPISDVHTEPRAPDIRYMALMLLIPAWLALNRFTGSLKESALPSPDSAMPNRILCAVAWSFCTAWALWLWTSGNSRYFLPMGCIAGVLAAVLLVRVFKRPRPRVYAIAALCSVQTINVSLNPSRWHPASWSDRWFMLEIPRELETTPYLYLSVSAPSLSFLLPYLASGSGLVNISGAHVLDAEGATGAKVSELMARHKGRVRMIAGVHVVTPDGAPAPALADYDYRLQKFGVYIDVTSCVSIKITGSFSSVVIGPPTNQAHPATANGENFAFTCGLQPLPPTAAASSHETKEYADTAFDLIEERCPDLFAPRGAVTEKKHMGWRRLYASTDAQLWTYNGNILALRYPLDFQPILFGKLADWLQSPLRVDCPRRRAAFVERITFNQKTPEPLRGAFDVDAK